MGDVIYHEFTERQEDQQSLNDWLLDTITQPVMTMSSINHRKRLQYMDVGCELAEEYMQITLDLAALGGRAVQGEDVAAHIMRAVSRIDALNDRLKDFMEQTS